MNADIGDLPRPDLAYGWDNVIQKEKTVAVNNADNYAYFGLFGGMHKNGYRLVSPNLEWSNSKMSEAEIRGFREAQKAAHDQGTLEVTWDSLNELTFRA